MDRLITATATDCLQYLERIAKSAELDRHDFEDFITKANINGLAYLELAPTRWRPGHAGHRKNHGEREAKIKTLTKTKAK